MRIGVRLPVPSVDEGLGLAPFAREAERVGFDSLWVSDHVLMPASIDSHYPFSRDGRATWSPDSDWYDPIVLLSMAASATSRVRLGTAVLIAPLRQPVVLAKQWATLDRLSGGRTALGIGVGWLAEEFEALGVPFRQRGALTDEWIDVVRAVWTGAPSATDGPHYPLPAGLITKPAPEGGIPVLLGGTSAAALRRAAAVGDGWIAHDSLAEIEPDELGSTIRSLDSALADLGRPRDRFEVVLRLVGTSAIHEGGGGILADLAAIGVDEVVLDPPEGGVEALAAFHTELRRAAAQTPQEISR
ncbi:TIGR03619 family F420-dependent LLM class oxidoreductase [Amnibacterium flavum]|uniref:LLM class F420-dependent oxidoreductase n=1 Tax=Amnibacterium flavum TaxID=2173173 RepID=A0A2V1HU03_9MICO|nr:TIGR03619 family F420-dependent LLM class oxidoreductase [Amnibacterium flavum]PVZ96086.1 LLM class F420-dependent oxidoreductase [Amnibacterium flavum]